jgi:hypothetical protein
VQTLYIVEEDDFTMRDDDRTGDMEACTSGIMIELSGFLEIPTMAFTFLLRQEFL